MLITVPIPKFKEIESKLAIENIPEGYVINHIILDNKKYVITGGCGNGKGGWEYFWMTEIIPLEIYTGDLKPLNYGEHWKEVRAEKRPRRYAGML
ncbi:MAG TPA: hypothetical protein VI413_00920, partial [Paludibacter sp.]